MIKEIVDRIKKEVLRKKNEKGEKSFKITPIMIEEWERKTAVYYSDGQMDGFSDLDSQ